jgi:hypothetical protein
VRGTKFAETTAESRRNQGGLIMRLMWAGLLRVASALVAASLLAGAASAQSTGKTIKFIPEADLRSLDPIWTTASYTCSVSNRKPVLSSQTVNWVGRRR